MNTALMNQLLEEAVTRSRELSDAADEALRAIDGMATEAEELAQRVDTETAGARQHLRELVSRLERSEAALEAAGQQAEGAQDGLSGKSAELATEAAGLRDRVTKSLAELDARHDHIEADLTARMTTAHDDARELAESAHAAQTSVEEDLEQVDQALFDFRAAIDTARSEFEEKQRAWRTAANALETESYTHAGAWTGGLSDLLQRQSTVLVDAANSMIVEHNAAMDVVRSRFVEQAPKDLDEALAPLEVELGELGRSAASRAQALAADGARLAQWAETAVPVVEGLRAALDVVAPEE